MSGEDDLLEQATRALRASAPPTESELAAGKGALLWAHRASQHKKRRGRTLRWVLPLAAVLAAGSAFAHTTGRLERVAEVVSELLGTSQKRAQRAQKQPRPAASALSARRDAAEQGAAVPTHHAEPTDSASDLASSLARGTERADGAAVATTPPSAPRTTAPASERGSAEKRRARQKRAELVEPAQPTEPTQAAEPEEYAREGAADEPAETPAPVPSADLARYREAHRAHFRARDFAAALRGWDTYLSEFPHGTFAIEARYNRAICLWRLARKDEARRALAPFARGLEGRGYRQAEASKLLEALE
jgi:TolA-binding protein